MSRRRRSAVRTVRDVRDERAESPTRAALPNGLRIIIVPCPQLAQAYVGLFFGVGSRHERLEENGITHTLEHMLFRGTTSYVDATALNSAAEAFGGFLEGATYRDHLFFGTGCHPSAVGNAVAILGELATSPRYQGVEVERAILREELLETIDRDGRMIDLDNIAHRAVFGAHGLGLPIEGTLANLERTTVAHLEQHRRRFLVGDNAVLAIAGPLDAERVLAQSERAFADLPAGPRPPPAPPPGPGAEPRLRYVRDASSQVDMRICFRAVTADDQGYPALVMLARLLGDGLASRMNAELVDRRGLAYVLHAGLTRYSDCALFDFEIAVAPDRAAEAAEALLHFAHAASRFRFTPEEMQRVRRRYRYGTEFRRDSVADLVAWHGTASLFGIEDELARMERRIVAVTAAEVREAARGLFRRDGLVLTAVGELARGEWARVRRVVESWKG